MPPSLACLLELCAVGAIKTTATFPRLYAQPFTRSVSFSRRATIGASSSDGLLASLRARIAEDASGVSFVPRGPDEIGMSCMTPTDVASHVMRGLARREWEVLLEFASTTQLDAEASNRILPGAFSDSERLELHVRDRFPVLAGFHQWQCVLQADGLSPVIVRDFGRKATQQVRIKRSGTDGTGSRGWSQLNIHLVLVPYRGSRRWVITSMDVTS